MNRLVRLGRFILRRALPPGPTAESVVGDLDQEYRELVASNPHGRYGAWYLLEAMKIGIRFRFGRFVSLASRPSARGGTTKLNPFERCSEEVRWSFRRVVRTPGMAAFAAIAIGLGIGATATMFSLVHTGLQKLPYPDSERLMALSWEEPARGLVELGLTAREFTEWNREQRSFESLAGYSRGSMTISGQVGFPERIDGAWITADVLPVLGIAPAEGRSFLKEEEAPGASSVAIISHGLWARRYGEDPGILGQTLRVDGIDRTIVGVMPVGFRFPGREDLWVPLGLDPEQIQQADLRHLTTFGRLRKESTPKTAEAEFSALAQRFATDRPTEYEGLVFRMGSYQDYIIGGDAAVILYSLLAVVSFVLLVACASVANLLLARAVRQTREIAVRMAMGASRARVIAQVLTECLLISIGGGFVGVGLAYLGAGFLQRTMGSDLPYFWMSIRVDPAVLVFAFGLAFLSSLVAGLVPALRASDLSVSETLKEEGHGSTGVRLGRWGRRLIVAEVALSAGLLTVAGLTAKDVMSLARVDRGFDAKAVLTARVSLDEGVYPAQEDWSRIDLELVQGLRGKPGVRNVALSSSLPGRAASRSRLQLEGQPVESSQALPRSRLRVVTSEFFQVLGAGPVEGRVFSPSDNAESPRVAVVNESFARRFFPGESPVGRRVRLGDLDSDRPWRTIVGTVPDLNMNGADRSGPEGIYVPLGQRPQQHVNVLLSTASDPLALSSLLRGTVADVDANLPVYNLGTLDTELNRDAAGYWSIAALLLASGLSALLMAGVGLFGVLAFSVSSRAREMGIRVAMGARANSVLWMILWSGLRQIGAGLLAGIVLALGVSLALQEMFQTTSPLDLRVYGAVAGILTLGGILASLPPAMRAVRTDPAATLRVE